VILINFEVAEMVLDQIQILLPFLAGLEERGYTRFAVPAIPIDKLDVS